MTLRILIAECDPPEEALALLKGAGETAADAFARALRPLADTQPLFPWYSDFSLSDEALARADGLIFAGHGGGMISEADPAGAFLARALAAGRPVFAAGRGMSLAALCAGAEPREAEGAGIARSLIAEPHLMTKNRRGAFDALRPAGPLFSALPGDAKVTVRDRAGHIHGFALGALFATSFSPAATLGALAFWLRRTSPAAAKEISVIARDPPAAAALMVKRRIGADLIDEASRMHELLNWLAMIREDDALAGRSPIVENPK